MGRGADHEVVDHLHTEKLARRAQALGKGCVVLEWTPSPIRWLWPTFLRHLPTPLLPSRPMCGRISLIITNPDELGDQLEADWEPGERERFKGPRYNVGPMQSHPILRAASGHRALAYARWGVPRVIGKHADGSLKISHPFNTVAETEITKPAWRKALTERRCIVPATSFYEWTGPKKARMPLSFARRDGGLLLLAGVYDEPKGDEPLGFSVLTTAPNATMAAIHDRMPVILEAVAAGGWLDAGGDALLRPAPDDLLVSAAANPIMNRAGVEGPECLVVSAAAT